MSNDRPLTGAERQRLYWAKPGKREINNKKQQARRLAYRRLINTHRAEYLKLYSEALKELGVEQ